MTRARELSKGGIGIGLTSIYPGNVVVNSGSATVGSTGKVTFSGAGNVELNQIFSTEYDNYRIILSAEGGAVANNYVAMYMRFGSGTGTLYNSSSIYTQQIYSDGTSTSSSRTTANYFHAMMYSYTDNSGTCVMDVINPNRAFPTRAHWTQAYGTSGIATHTNIGVDSSSTQFTGVTLSKISGTWNGIVSVYGYKAGA